MLADQRKLGAKFSNFIAGLPEVDWQIGVTTTDVDSKTGFKGSLAEFMKSGQYVLTPQTPNAQTLFSNTVVRPESVICEKDYWKCGSGHEQPLAATMLAISKANSDNRGFFRDYVDFAVLVISDEDELSDGKSKKATKPQAVVDYFKSVWGQSKKFAGYGIIIQPGDKACLKAQRKEPRNAGYYGTKVAELAQITGGSTMSICENDYGPALKGIGDNIRKLISSFELAKVPLPGSVEVILTPAQSIGYRIEGKKVVFDRAPAAGTRIDVRYRPAN